jgi:hypothetical protein
MSDVATYPLRLPRSLRANIERVSKRDGTSINQFVTMAAAEKLAAIDTEDYFRTRVARADLDAFDRLMARTGGEAPREGDEP